MYNPRSVGGLVPQTANSFRNSPVVPADGGVAPPRHADKHDSSSRLALGADPSPTDRTNFGSAVLAAASLIVSMAFINGSGCRDESDEREVFADNYHGARVTSVAFSPLENVFASGGADDTIHLFDASGAGTVYRPSELRDSPLRGHGSAVESLAFSGAATLLAAGNSRLVSGGYAQLWMLATPIESLEVTAGSSAVLGLSFSSDGEWLAMSDGDVYGMGGAYLVPMSSGLGSQRLFEARGPIRSVAFSPDSTRLAAATPEGVWLWNLVSDEGSAIVEDEFVPASVAWGSSLESVLYAAGKSNPSGFGGIAGVVKVFDLEHDTVMTMDLSNKPLRAVACSTGGELVAAAGEDHAVYVVDPHSGSVLVRLNNHFGAVNSLAFSADGQLLVSGGDDKYVRLWYVGDLLPHDDTDSEDTQSQTGSASETESGTQTETQTDSASETLSDTSTQTETQTETQTDSASETLSDTSTQTETQTETQTDSASETLSDTSTQT